MSNPTSSPTETNDERTVRAARELTNAVNILSFDPKLFAETIRRDHRTIQQGLGRVVFELISQWADDWRTGNYDLRNEDTCKACFELFQDLDEGALITRYI